jgi:hypothetical protein
VIAHNDRINQYYKIHNKLPSPNWLAVICKISIDDAKELLNEQDEKQDTNEKINLPPHSRAKLNYSNRSALPLQSQAMTEEMESKIVNRLWPLLNKMV